MPSIAHPRCSATSTRPAGPRTGYSHPLCYARGLGDCSHQISREHYTTRNILIAMGGSAEVSGLRWLKGETRRLPADAIVAKILCDRHNSALSPLDAEAGRLFETLREFDAAFADTAVPTSSSLAVLNGSDIERWLLKCLIGAAHSGGLETSSLRELDRCVAVLFGEADWPSTWGLSLFPHRDSEHSYNGIAFMTMLGSDGRIWGLVASIAGIPLLLSVGIGTNDRLRFHPGGIVFSHAKRDAEKVLALAWPTDPTSGFLSFTRSVPYGGEPFSPF